MIRGRLYFNDTLRRPGKVPELAMGYSMTVPLAREFRDAYREMYWQLMAFWLVGYNPQLLLTDQREDRTQEVLESLFDNGLLHLGASPFAVSTRTGRWSGALLSQSPKLNHYRKD